MRTHAHPNVEPATRSFVRVCTQSLPNREVSGVEIVVSDAVIRIAPGFDPQTLAQAVAALRTLAC